MGGPLTDPHFCTKLEESKDSSSGVEILPFLDPHLIHTLSNTELEYYQVLYNLILNKTSIDINQYRLTRENLATYSTYNSQNLLVPLYTDLYSKSNKLSGSLFFRQGIEALAQKIIENKSFTKGIELVENLFNLMNQAGLISSPEVVEMINEIKDAETLVRKYGPPLEEAQWLFQNFITSAPPLNHDLILFRGMHYDPFYQISDIDQIFHLEGITSTTLNMTMAQNFGHIIFMFLVPPGFSVLPLINSYFPEEAEVLLPHSTAYKLLGLRRFGSEEGFNFIDYYDIESESGLSTDCFYRRDRAITIYFCQVIGDIS